MPVFDFNDAPVSKEKCVCTYTTFRSNEPEATPEKPLLVLDNHKKQWASFGWNVYQSHQTQYL